MIKEDIVIKSIKYLTMNFVLRITWKVTKFCIQWPHNGVSLLIINEDIAKKVKISKFF